MLPEHSFLSLKGDRVIIEVYISPGAKVSKIIGEYDACLKVAIAAKAVDGKANQRLIADLSKWLDISKRDIAIVSGEKNRRKRIAIAGASLEDLSIRIKNYADL